jgi:translin
MLEDIMGKLRNLEKIVAVIENELDRKEKVREVSIKSARHITRQSSSAIKKMQMGANPTSILRKTKAEALELRRVLRKHPELEYSGYVETAFQELSEAFIISAIKNNKPLPLPASVGVTNTAYLLGMGDAIGELRRFALLALTKGHVKKANDYLNMMEELFSALMRFDYPQAIVAIRRKQDVARSLIEKTRGDILVSSRSRELERKIERLHKKLK